MIATFYPRFSTSVGVLLFSTSSTCKSISFGTQFVASKFVTANDHFASSEMFIGGLNQLVCICLIVELAWPIESAFSWCSNVSCSFVFFCSLSLSVCVLIRINKSILIQPFWIPLLQCFSCVFILFLKV